MNDWTYSLSSCHNTENTAMTLLCHPCLYGINNSKIESLNGEPNPSMIPGTCTYLTINAGFQLSVLFYIGIFGSIIGIVPPDAIVHSATVLCGMIGTGLYAGRFRTQIRAKYNINGSARSDCCIHTMASPCALAQEANEIQYQSLNNAAFVYYSPLDAPCTEKMKQSN